MLNAHIHKSNAAAGNEDGIVKAVIVKPHPVCLVVMRICSDGDLSATVTKQQILYKHNLFGFSDVCGLRRATISVS